MVGAITPVGALEQPQSSETAFVVADGWYSDSVISLAVRAFQT